MTGTTPPPIRYGEFAPRLEGASVDVRAIIEGVGPIEFEIGFGRGAFLRERTLSAPDARVFGVEIKAKWAHHVSERLRRDGLSRARAYCGDARELLPRLGPDGSIARVFIHFPDPWWKKKHAKRAVIGDTLLDHVARLLAPSGELFVQTDVLDRAHAYRSRIEAHGAFDFTHDDLWLDANPFGARSNRELRADEDGLPVYRMLARRRR